METVRVYSNADINRIKRKAVRDYKKERRDTFFLVLGLITIFAIITLCGINVLMYGY